jgi:hypothetical protein
MMTPILAITFGPLEIAFAVIAGLSLIFVILFLFAKDPNKANAEQPAKPEPEVVNPPVDEQNLTEGEGEEPVPALLVDQEEEKTPRPKPPFNPTSADVDEEVKLPKVPDLPEPKLPSFDKPDLPPVPKKRPVEDKSDDPEMKVEISPFVKEQGKDLPPKPGADSIEDEADQQTIEEEREA